MTRKPCHADEAWHPGSDLTTPLNQMYRRLGGSLPTDSFSVCVCVFEVSPTLGPVPGGGDVTCCSLYYHRPLVSWKIMSQLQKQMTVLGWCVSTAERARTVTTPTPVTAKLATAACTAKVRLSSCLRVYLA